MALRRLASPWLRIEGVMDIHRVRTQDPLFPTEEDLGRAKADLKPAYERYIEAVSPADMAASLQTNALLLALCRKNAASSCLDLGSGFSSYVLRRWAKECGVATVASVDDDSEWLSRTQAFVESEHLPVEGFYLWPDLPEGQFDVVLHDFASGAKREEAMPIALERTARFLVLDDAQHWGHRSAMRAVCRGAGVPCYSVRSLTLDEFRRYAILAIRGWGNKDSNLGSRR